MSRPELDAEYIMSGTSFGAWWAVAEAASKARSWANVEEDPALRALMAILTRTAAALSEGENYLDPRAAIGPE